MAVFSIGATGSINITGSYSYTSSSLFNMAPTTTTYHVLGEDVEVDGYKDGTTSLYVSMVNVMGREFYEEVKKQGISFPSAIEEVIKRRLVIHDRDKKLNSLL